MTVLEKTIFPSGFRTRPNGLPVLSAEEISAHAEHIVRCLQPELFEGQPDAVNLQLVLNHLRGWHYAGRYLSLNGSLLGVAIFEGGRIQVTDGTRQSLTDLLVPPHTILVDRGLYDRSNERIFRFTLAHEMGHACYHEAFCSNEANMRAYAEEGRQRLLEDAASRFEIRDRRRLRNGHDWVEWQANAFASSLLLPKTLMYQTAAMVREGEKTMSEQEFANEMTQTVMDVFRVSQSAAFYRLKELEILPPTARRLPNGVILQTRL